MTTMRRAMMVMMVIVVTMTTMAMTTRRRSNKRSERDREPPRVQSLTDYRRLIDGYNVDWD